MLVEMNATSRFNQTFKLPKTEKLLADYSCSLWKAHRKKYCKGRLCLSQNYVSFHSESMLATDPDRPRTYFILKGNDLVSVKEESSEHFAPLFMPTSSRFALKFCKIFIHLDPQGALLLTSDRKMACEQIEAIRLNCDLITTELFIGLHQFFLMGDEVESQTDPLASPLGITSLPEYNVKTTGDVASDIQWAFDRMTLEVLKRFGDGLVTDKYSLSEGYPQKQWKQEQDLQEYFSKNSSGGSAVIYSEDLFSLIQGCCRLTHSWPA